jgi:LDH2 family malate/lactate/ureidoglycolate dehydrogenase
MMVELLNGVLAGTGSLPIGARDDWSHIFVAISLASLGDPDQLRHKTQDMIDRIRAAETRDGSEVRIPGHRSLARRDAALARGTVDVDPNAFEQLKDLV